MIKKLIKNCLLALATLTTLVFIFMVMPMKTKGTSMKPIITDGTILLAQTCFDQYHIPNGTIIVYHYNSTLNILHRIINVTDSYYIVKGDNNPGPDPPVYPEQIYGVLLIILWKD